MKNNLKFFIVYILLVTFIFTYHVLSYDKVINNNTYDVNCVYEYIPDTIIDAMSYVWPKNISKHKIDTLIRIAFYAEHVGVSHTDWYISKVIIETGWLSSNSWLKANNTCGMSPAYIRPTTRIRETFDTDYAWYDHWQLSVIDYSLWQTEFGVHSDENEFLELLAIYEPNNPALYQKKLEQVHEYAKQIVAIANTY